MVGTIRLVLAALKDKLDDVYVIPDKRVLGIWGKVEPVRK